MSKVLGGRHAACHVRSQHCGEPHVFTCPQTSETVANLLPSTSSHAYGQTFYSVNYPKISEPMYVMRKFDFIKLLEYIQKYRITNLALVPPVVIALTKRKETKDYDLSSLEDVGCGAAPLTKESTVEFETAFNGKVGLRQGWGMTEVTCSGATWDPNSTDIDQAAIGELIPNGEGRIVDEQGNDLGPDEIGEFYIRAPNVMKGYWNRPEETKKTMTPDGWLKTGDVGFRSKDNWLHIIDRKKERKSRHHFPPSRRTH